MSRLKYLAALFLLGYSVLLLITEARTSQAYVRNYFTDLRGPVFFFGVNTSLSVAFLGGTALLCAVALLIHDAPRPWLTVDGRFLLTQVAAFAYLAMDDRFLLHERIGARLGVEDAWLVLALGVGEWLLLTYFRRSWDVKPARLLLAGAALFFALMIIIDGAVPPEVTLRLSIEDLSKTWSGFFLFLFGWLLVRVQLSRRLAAACVD